MVCKYLKRRSVTSRHAILLQLLVSFLREAGMQPIPEARTENGERPDLRLSLDGVPLLLDVSVTHPTMPSARSSGRSSHALGAARQREYEKMHKYAELGVMEGATVVPLVMESTGALGEGLRQFVSRISSRVRDGEFAGASPSVIERFLTSALAIALQRGNAAILREGASQLDYSRSSDPQHQRSSTRVYRTFRATVTTPSRLARHLGEVMTLVEQ